MGLPGVWLDTEILMAMIERLKSRRVRRKLLQGPQTLAETFKYSCFEKGCPTKPYATMPQGIMGNGGL